ITTGGSIARSAFRCSVISTRLSRAGRDGNTSGSNAGNEHRCTGWEASRDGTPICSSCGSSACDRRLEGRSRMRREFHVRFCEGGRVRFPSATRLIIGFQHESDGRRFLDEMRKRLHEFALSLHPDKTRLIEFGRFAAANREQRGLGKPETFNFLGFTCMCGKSRQGFFLLKRKTRRDRMRAKLRMVKQEMRRRMHQPIPEQGRWLWHVVRGYFNYHAVPMNTRALAVFRAEIARSWHRVLNRRSQKANLTRARMDKLIDDWLPKPRILHPWPDKRFAVTHPRWEPYAGKLHVRI